MNTAFDQYRKFYYGKGISSCYLWDTENSQHSFAGIVLIKKYEGAENTISGMKKNMTIKYMGRASFSTWLFYTLYFNIFHHSTG